MNILVKVLLLIILLSFPQKGKAQENFRTGVPYTANVSACLEKSDIDIMVVADKEGYANEMWQFLSLAGKCGNLTLELTFVKVIESFVAHDGVMKYIAEATVDGEQGKLTIYVATRRQILEVRA